MHVFRKMSKYAFVLFQQQCSHFVDLNWKKCPIMIFDFKYEMHWTFWFGINDITTYNYYKMSDNSYFLFIKMFKVADPNLDLIFLILNIHHVLNALVLTEIFLKLKKDLIRTI